jgi:hypothetical protein
LEKCGASLARFGGILQFRYRARGPRTRPFLHHERRSCSLAARLDLRRIQLAVVHFAGQHVLDNSISMILPVKWKVVEAIGLDAKKLSAAGLPLAAGALSAFGAVNGSYRVRHDPPLYMRRAGVGRSYTHHATVGFSFGTIWFKNAAARVKPSSGASKLSSCSTERTSS